MRNREITKSYFRTCSTCSSRSQALLYLYALKMISNHLERTFERLRYFLGGGRPSQTTYLTLSLWLHTSRLDTQYLKGGIQRSTPPKLAFQLPCLPPILYIKYQIPISSYSKAPWGLFVLSRLIGIFTDSLISPSLLLRQRPNRYAFRAGRNLPDKEFRYLRTVIVTAAVYWGFNLMLRCLTSPLNLPAPGRRQHLYFTLRFCRYLCF
jgi:hypothetical protein